MPDSRAPGDLPPDLPPEYAEAYRRGYERAYREATGHDPEQPEQAADPAPVADPTPGVDPTPVADPIPVAEPVEAPKHLATTPVAEPIRISGPLFADETGSPAHAAGASNAEVDAEVEDAEPTLVVNLRDQRQPSPRAETVFAPQPLVFDDAAPAPLATETPGGAGPDADTGRHAWAGGLADDLVVEDDVPQEDESRERPGWWVPALLGGLVLLLVVSAYAIGRIFSSSVGDADVSPEEPDGVVLGDGAAGGAGQGTGQDTGQGDGDGKGKAGNQQKGAYQGNTDPAVIGGATASCQAPDSVDAAGNPIGYPPTNVYDGDLTTAWRCNGTGVGQSLTLTLAAAGRIGEVGLVPGYAKTDPRSGVDRYAENNRLTRVRWTLADGTSFVQRLDGSATNRGLQTMRVPATQSDSVVLEVLASTRGPRNTMAVSEVRVGTATE